MFAHSDERNYISNECGGFTGWGGLMDSISVSTEVWYYNGGSIANKFG